MCWNLKKQSLILFFLFFVMGCASSPQEIKRALHDLQSKENNGVTAEVINRVNWGCYNAATTLWKSGQKTICLLGQNVTSDIICHFLCRLKI